MSAVLVAVHNKLDLAVGIACGSSVQIALFATPLLVLMSWVIPGERLTLVFSNFNVAALLLSVLVVNSTLADAKTNVLEGAVLVAAYAMLAAAYFLMG
jgi:Ca2+:H+ antiporter